MKYKLLGNTGLKVSELCLGTMTFGGKGYWTAIGQLPQEPVDQIVKRSVEARIRRMGRKLSCRLFIGKRQ